MRIMDSHPTEYRKRLNEILIVFREGQVIELIDQLNNTNYLSGRILDCHAKNRAMPKSGAVIHHRIESSVFVSVRYVDSLKIAFVSFRANVFAIVSAKERIKSSDTHFTGCRYVTRDTDIDRKSTLERTGEKKKTNC